MKRILFSIILFLSIPSAVPAADDAVARAMKLYEQRHYEDAALMLRTEITSLDPSRQGAANLTLGMIYLKNAELYRAFYEESLAATQDYLKKLSASKGSARSHFADLYRGQLLIESERPADAVFFLERFIADKKISPLHRSIAEVNLGLCHYLNDNGQEAERIWNGIDSASPEVRSELAAAYSRINFEEKDPVALCDDSLANVKKAGKQAPVRMVKNCLSVYNDSGLTDKGLALLRRVDGKEPSHKEVLGKLKVLFFYDPGLLDAMSALYGQASIASLEKAAANGAVKDAAEYYLAAAYFFAGSEEQSAEVAASFIATSRMSQHYKDRIRAQQAVHEYLQGNQAGALKVWTGLSQKQPADPDLLGEILFACARAKAECGAVSKRAESIAVAGQGKKFSILHFGLGRYALAKKNQGKALFSMERGRDKSNKNKIESNDPLMLADLAGLYYRSKKFSEAIEIYFEMSKQFPAVRQIQEAMQGVYAIEQKSAGDVKIF